jgi:hypothetical protein
MLAERLQPPVDQEDLMVFVRPPAVHAPEVAYSSPSDDFDFWAA